MHPAFKGAAFDDDFQTKLSLYSAYYAETCHEFALPISAIEHQGNKATCVDVEAVTKHLQRCVKSGRYEI